MITEKDIGKRVIVNGKCSDINLNNEKGVIIENFSSDCAIKFDIPNERFWEIDGENRGWYIHKDNIKFEKEKADIFDFSYMLDENKNPYSKGAKIKKAFYKTGFPIKVDVLETGLKVLSHNCLGEEKILDTKIRYKDEIYYTKYRFLKNFRKPSENKKMTGIRIETKKVVDDAGILCREILKIKALPKSKLPDIYLLSDGPIVWKFWVNLHLENVKNQIHSHCNIMQGERYSEEFFEKCLDHCRAAGDNLMECNRILAEKRAEWEGEETFII
jgi:hypothetical protein